MNKPIVDLVSTVRATVTQHKMLLYGKTVVVAVSGGPDSTALLHLLASLRAEYNLTLVAAHLNHGFRGAEADADADYVAALCRDLGVDCVVEKIDVPEVQQRRRLSAQEAARDVRHAFLRRVAREVSAAKIALGHTADDRVETILINLLRGTGAEGLGGFPPVALPLIRPLYDATHRQVTHYCTAQGLEPRHDSSNSKPDYLRNRIRAELLPHLRTYYNEKVDASLLRMAELVSADDAVLESLATTFLSESSVSVTVDERAIPGKALLELPLALQRRAVRQAIGGIRGHLQGATFEMVEGVVMAVARGERHSITLPASGAGTVSVIVDADAVRVRRTEPASTPVPWQQDVAVPGETHLDAAGIGLRTVWYGRAAESISLVFGAHTGDAVAYVNLEPMLFRLQDIVLPLIARSWRPGDRIRLSRASGTKKLQDLFVDRKIPLMQRSRCAVLCAADGTILAVIGIAVASVALRPHEIEAALQSQHAATVAEASEIEAGEAEADGTATDVDEEKGVEAPFMALFPYRLPVG